MVSTKNKVGGGDESASSHDHRSRSKNPTNGSNRRNLLEEIFTDNTQEDVFSILSSFSGKFHVRYNSIRNCIELYPSDEIASQFVEQEILLHKIRSNDLSHKPKRSTKFQHEVL